MRNVFLAAAILAVPTAIHAEAAPKFSTATSTISALMADPAAKAVVVKHMPQLEQAAGMVGGQTLKELQGMAPDRLTDSLLAAIDADLVKIK